RYRPVVLVDTLPLDGHQVLWPGRGGHLLRLATVRPALSGSAEIRRLAAAVEQFQPGLLGADDCRDSLYPAACALPARADLRTDRVAARPGAAHLPVDARQPRGAAVHIRLGLADRFHGDPPVGA